MTNATRTLLLAILLAGVATPALAQTSDAATTDTANTDATVVNQERDDNDFPWGLLGLLGLAGLMGRKRDTIVRTEDRTQPDGIRR